MVDLTLSCPVSMGGTLFPNVHRLGFHVGQCIQWLVFDSTNEKLPTTSIVSAFVSYKEWWMNLYSNDPTHVYVETTLIILIIYFLVSRKRGENYWKDRTRKAEKLTPAEEEELLLEWKYKLRQPLASLSSESAETDVSSTASGIVQPKVTVHKNNGRLMEVEISCNGINRKTVLNFATFDFLGMASDDPVALSMNHQPENNNDETKVEELAIKSPESFAQIQNPVKQAALKALDRYGCGSCGPRGFYGTIDVHLQLESKFAQYMKTDASILYSDGSSAISSTIAAFCKRGDLLVVDDACYEPIRTGVLLSRANVKFFKHNDMDDLRSVLKKAHDADLKIGRKPNAQRRFLVVEGLYKNTGSICPLDEIVQLKHQYAYRLILDESHSFGTLGATGKGVTELYGKQMMSDVEIVTVSIENAIGSIGGLTIGSAEIVDHQRLCGVGYCFSASSPPFTAAAAIEALNILDSNNFGLITKLHSNVDYMYTELSKLLSKETDDLVVITSDKRSPIMMLQLGSNIPETRFINENVFVHEVVNECLINGNVAFIATGSQVSDTDALTTSEKEGLAKSDNSKYKAKTTMTTLPKCENGEGMKDPLSCIRVAITASQTKHDMDQAMAVLIDSIDAVINRCMLSTTAQEVAVCTRDVINDAENDVGEDDEVEHSGTRTSSSGLSTVK